MGTEMKELEEHLAKAMHSADYKSGRFEWEEYDAGTRAAYLEGARSVLRAIEDAGYVVMPKEPTDAMMFAGARPRQESSP